MSLYGTRNQAEADSSPGIPSLGEEPAKAGARERWSERCLPPAGFERKVFLLLAALVLGLKVLAIYHLRLDSDEAQHAHVIWGWTTGRLQYRDLFDNHMPLFHMAYAPLMAALGERADIQVLLRWAVLPLYLVCLWCVFKLTVSLYSRRYAPWVCLLAAALPRFFLTSTEFRTDDLWAAFWLLGLVVAATGKFTIRRAFVFGLLVGLTAAVSTKTIVLAAAIFTATGFAMILAWMRREQPGVGAAVGRLAAMGVGAAIPPVAAFLYFAYRRAFWIMYYCVIKYNAVLGMKGWHDYKFLQWWSFPFSLVVLAFCALLIFRQTPDTGLATRRTIILLTPWFFLALFLSYSPTVTREDDLPYIPLTPLLAIPLLTWFTKHWRFPRVEALFFPYLLPAICFAELIFDFIPGGVRKDRVSGVTRRINDILALTGPNDYVMDDKGDSIFRMRPLYWVFEVVTDHNIRFGLLHVHVPEALEKTETKVSYMNASRFVPEASRFIVTNYLLFDPRITNLGVAGKELISASGDDNYSFDVAIPATYAVVSESGNTAGQLDGAPYAGPVRLEAGRHRFQRTSGYGRAAIFLARARAEGFHPLFDQSEKLANLKQQAEE